MSKIEIPIAEVEIGGSLFNFYYNNAIIRSDVQKTTTDTLATASDNFNLSISEVASILAGSGEVYEYLMAVRAPIAILGANVPVGLPKRLKWDATVKTFNDWFVPGAELWEKDDNTEIIFYTNPFATNAASYLLGSEISIINQIGASVTILTIADAQAVTASGWTKL